MSDKINCEHEFVMTFDLDGQKMSSRTVSYSQCRHCLQVRIPRGCNDSDKKRILKSLQKTFGKTHDIVVKK